MDSRPGPFLIYDDPLPIVEGSEELIDDDGKRQLRSQIKA